MNTFSRICCVVLGFGFVGSPVAAQLMNDPVQLSPKDETGLTVAGDVGQGINGASGDRTSFNGRVTLGLPSLQVSVGVGLQHFNGVLLVSGSTTPATWVPAATRANFMGLVALKLIPGTPAVPVNLDLFAGVGYAGHASAWRSTVTTLPVGLAIGVDLSLRGTSIEPWIAPRFSHVHVSGTEAETDYGISGGLNVGLSAAFGLQAAVDYLNVPGASPSLVLASIGLHYRFSVLGLGERGR